MPLLSVKNLRKEYPGFCLDNVSFSLEEGSIMGFIGRNGAGKTTTIKAMLNLIPRDGGEVLLDEVDFFANENRCKQEVGLVMGAFDCYPTRTLGAIAAAARPFYPNWDEAAYRGYLTAFSLEEGKKVKELSAGMQVKFALALALSHGARLLILDEPTSGLDPVSREELLDIFRRLMEQGDKSILFSTHVISDLEKCADAITYIQGGQVLASQDLISFREEHLLVAGEAAQLPEKLPYLLGFKQSAFGFTGLIARQEAPRFCDCRLAPADLESIMLYREAKHEAPTV